MGGNGGKAQIYGPGGEPIKKQPGLVVIKVFGDKPVHPQILGMVAKALGCDVLMIPNDVEILAGQVAWNEVEKLHEGIHKLEERKK